MFQLDPRLENDTVKIGELALCDLLLATDANYPWVILVPRQANITELYQLSEDDQLQLMREISAVSRRMTTHFLAHKINVAALGNVVAQLHVHIIARYDTDPAWPGPIWGKVDAIAYPEDELESTVNSLKALLGDLWI